MISDGYVQKKQDVINESRYFEFVSKIIKEGILIVVSVRCHYLLVLGLSCTKPFKDTHKKWIMSQTDGKQLENFLLSLFL